MKIDLKKPLSINHIGGRSNNEDSIYPLIGNANKNDKLFLVCDGVGGNEKGEVASRMTCDSFAEYFDRNPTGASDKAYIAKALEHAEANIDKYITENPQAKGMGTTLTLLHLHSKGATIAHVGDSRVYQFRDGHDEYVTSDHSMVNDLLKAGVINEEQAKDHPRKNVISRAVQGASVKATKADVVTITDIRPGDYFFLCSDGILENISDFEIAQILLQDIGNKDKMDQINKQCEIAPNDNFSAYLVPVESVEGAIAEANKESTIVEATVVIEAEAKEDIKGDGPEGVLVALNDVQTQKTEFDYKKPKKIFSYFLVAIALIILVYWLGKGGTLGEKQKEENGVQKTYNPIDIPPKEESSSSTNNTEGAEQENQKVPVEEIIEGTNDDQGIEVGGSGGVVTPGPSAIAPDQVQNAVEPKEKIELDNKVQNATDIINDKNSPKTVQGDTDGQKEGVGQKENKEK